jgi:hypothetical protein
MATRRTTGVMASEIKKAAAPENNCVVSIMAY